MNTALPAESTSKTMGEECSHHVPRVPLTGIIIGLIIGLFMWAAIILALTVVF